MLLSLFCTAWLRCGLPRLSAVLPVTLLCLAGTNPASAQGVLPSGGELQLDLKKPDLPVLPIDRPDARLTCPFRLFIETAMQAPEEVSLRYFVKSDGGAEVLGGQAKLTDTIEGSLPAGEVLVVVRAPGHTLFSEKVRHGCRNALGLIGVTTNHIASLTLKLGETRSAMLRLPFASKVSRVTYRAKDGLALMDDIVLGAEDEIARRQAGDQTAPWYSGRMPAPPPQPERDLSGTGDLRTVRQPLLALSDPDLLWPDGVVPYEISAGDFTLREEGIIREHMDRIEQVSNVRFINEPGYGGKLLIRQDSSVTNVCGSSPVGRQSDEQVLILNDRCVRPGNRTVTHELLHALGMFHEQNRPDREKYVRILSDNIQEDVEGNFDRAEEDATQTLTPYDYASIMHYSSRAFGKRMAVTLGITARKTIECVAADCDEELMGGEVLSRLDQRGLRLLYPGLKDHLGGGDWHNAFAATGIAIGDLTGNGKGEVVVVSDTPVAGEARVHVLDRMTNYAPLRGSSLTGADWGNGAYGTAVAMGNIGERLAALSRDGDIPRQEVAIGRRSTVNMRMAVYGYEGAYPQGRLMPYFEIGKDWGTSSVRDIAFGDLDGDGIDEIAVATDDEDRGSGYQGTRPGAVQVIMRGRKGTAAQDQYFPLRFDGHLDGHKAIAVAWAELGCEAPYPLNGVLDPVNACGLDAAGARLPQKKELIVLTDADRKGEARIYAFSIELDSGSASGDPTKALKITRLFTAGEDWGPGARATDIAVGQLDEDALDEIAVSRDSSVNLRVKVLETDLHRNYTEPKNDNKRPIGETWARDIAASRVAMADLDGDGLDEIIVGRMPHGNKSVGFQRVMTFSWSQTKGALVTNQLVANDYPVDGSDRITALAAGDVTGDGKAELGIGNTRVTAILSGGGGFGSPSAHGVPSFRFGVLSPCRRDVCGASAK